jgi:hypothetical protein
MEGAWDAFVGNFVGNFVGPARALPSGLAYRPRRQRTGRFLVAMETLQILPDH